MPSINFCLCVCSSLSSQQIYFFIHCSIASLQRNIFFLIFPLFVIFALFISRFSWRLLLRKDKFTFCNVYDLMSQYYQWNHCSKLCYFIVLGWDPIQMTCKILKSLHVKSVEECCSVSSWYGLFEEKTEKYLTPWYAIFVDCFLILLLITIHRS